MSGLSVRRLAIRVADWLATRTERALVEADIREEFEFHLSEIGLELAAQGVSGAAASAQSRARFGDTERLVREGGRVKAGGLMMLQRINLGLLIVLGIALVLVALPVGGAAVEPGRDRTGLRPPGAGGEFGPRTCVPRRSGEKARALRHSGGRHHA